MTETVILIPCKSLDQAKSRLHGKLEDKERQVLAFNLMVRTFLVASNAALGKVVVITDDTRIRNIASSIGAGIYPEASPGGLNRSMQAAFNSMNRQSAILYLPADLPLIVQDDLLQVVKWGEEMGRVVIVGDQSLQGTNMLYIPMQMDFTFQFGPDSFRKHQVKNAGKARPLEVINNENIAFDLDSKEDLAFFVEMGNLGL